MVQTSLVRAALLVAFGALFDAVVGPYLTFGGVSPNLTMICVVVSASSVEELQGIVLGFFGGVLVDALGVAPGLFGAGALAGVIAGWIATRAGELQRKRASGALMAQVVALVVAVNDLIKLAATCGLWRDQPNVPLWTQHYVFDAPVDQNDQYGLRNGIQNADCSSETAPARRSTAMTTGNASAAAPRNGAARTSRS